MKINSLLLAKVCLCLVASNAMAQSGQDRLDSAKRLERESPDNALIEYRRLIDTDSDPQVKLESKFLAGRIYLDEKGDVAQAQPFFEEVAKAVRYPNLAAMGLLYSGKAILATAKEDAEYNRALSEFDTIINAYPQSPAFVEALIEGANVLERQHKFERAIINYQSVVFGFPDSVYTPTAFIRLAHALARQGRFVDALRAYQNVQTLQMTGADAALAKKEATLLYRLFLLKDSDIDIFKAHVVAQKSSTLKLSNPSKLRWRLSGDLQILDDGRLFNVSPSGKVGPAPTIPDCLDRRGRDYRISGKTIIPAGSRPITPFFNDTDGEPKNFGEIIACAADRPGEVLISTRNPDGVFVADAQSGATARFGLEQKPPQKMTIDSEGNIYLFYQASSAITIIDMHAKLLATVMASQAAGIEELVDFALDGFDNLYLLDSKGKFVVLGGNNFTEQVRLKPQYTQNVVESSAKVVTNLRAITVTPTGAVYVAGKEKLFLFE